MNIIDDWSNEVSEQTNGAVKIKMYPNGVAGDEPDVLRKIRYGQLQGGLFSGYGIGRFYSPARVLEIPFMYESLGEVDYVRDALMPEIEQGYRDNGFELIGWMEVGFVRFFSKNRFTSLDELRQQRVWLWQGDPLASAFFSSTGISPIPLSIIDVYTSLSTGLIDTVYTTPLASLALQWFNKTRYISKIQMVNAIGSIVVDRRVFAKLTPEHQAILRATGAVAGQRLVDETRRDNETSMTVLLEKGHELVLDWDDIDLDELEELRATAVAELVESGYIPEDILRRALNLIEEYRENQPDDDASVSTALPH
jgi:TRAP-type C4-dicarboxylate transport system substrate-binding protein